MVASTLTMAKFSVVSPWLTIMVYLGILGSHISHCQPNKPALYIFGDSTVDVGTNDYLRESKARADFPHNGIDFPHSRPTGRFSNGYNTADSIAQLFGFDESPPPFLSFLAGNLSQFFIETAVPTRGINFASGGSGLLRNTGQQKWVRVISLGEQVEQFSSVRSNISAVLGESCAVANISKSLFIISVGSNDIFEHFGYKRTGRDYIITLISTYETHLKNLFELGARRFGIVSVGAIGCCPIQRNVTQFGGCLDTMNVDAQLFYIALRDLLKKLSKECKGFKYALGDSYSMSKYIFDHPEKTGFTNMTTACCGKGGRFNANSPCQRDSDLCGDRKAYLFWDQYHPTQIASYSAAFALCKGTRPFVAPMNFVDLAQLP